MYLQHAIWALLLLSLAVWGFVSARGLREEGNKVTETFSDIDGVHIIFDDMIITTVDEEDHDRIFRALLERTRAKQVKFNSETGTLVWSSPYT